MTTQLRSPLPIEAAIIERITFKPSEIKKLTILPDEFKSDLNRELLAEAIKLNHEGHAEPEADLGEGGFLSLLYFRVSQDARIHLMEIFKDPTADVCVKIEVLERELRAIWAESIVSEIVARENITDPVAINALIAQKIKELTPTVALRPFSEIASEVYKNIEREIDANGKPTGVPSGIQALDKITSGFQPGRVYVIAGRTSMGKSAAMANFFVSALQCGTAPVFVTLEDRDAALSQRMAAIVSGIPGKSPEDVPSVLEALDKIKALSPRIVSAHGMSSAYICGQVQRLHNHLPVGLVLIDHVQEVRENLGKYSQRHQEITQAMQNFRQLAHSLNVPVLIACQINRGVESRDDKRPGLSGLKESGSIEQIADVVMLLYRQSYYDGASPDIDTLEINIAKNRDGATGIVRAAFEPKCLRVSNWQSGCYCGQPDEQASKPNPYGGLNMQKNFIKGRNWSED